MIRAGYKKIAKVGLSSSGDTQNGAITPALNHDCCSRVFQSGFVEVDPIGHLDGGVLSARCVSYESQAQLACLAFLRLGEKPVSPGWLLPLHHCAGFASICQPCGATEGRADCYRFSTACSL
jgi:hypothetical protein